MSDGSLSDVFGLVFFVRFFLSDVFVCRRFLSGVVCWRFSSLGFASKIHCAEHALQNLPTQQRMKIAIIGAFSVLKLMLRFPTLGLMKRAKNTGLVERGPPEIVQSQAAASKSAAPGSHCISLGQTSPRSSTARSLQDYPESPARVTGQRTVSARASKRAKFNPQEPRFCLVISLVNCSANN